MTAVYQMLLNFKPLKYLKCSLSDPTFYDTFYNLIPSISNQEPSNLEYLVVNHLSGTNKILSIIQYTPKPRHLYLNSLDEPNIPLKNRSSAISKLPQLTKLIIENSKLTVEDLGFILNAFDCRLKILNMKTYSYSSFRIDEQWKKLMNTTLSDLNIFRIYFSKLGWSDLLNDEEYDEAEAENKCRAQSSIDFVWNPFWYDHGWTVQIYVSATLAQSLFLRSKSFDAVDNRQAENQLQKSIHFNNHQHHLNYHFLSSSYGLTLDGNLQKIGKNYFSNLKVNISYLPIKQLIIDRSNLFILDLLVILKNLPHVTFLSIGSESILEIKDEKNEEANGENRFDHIDQLEINANMS
ncbi:unnamed protein product [Rotaria magnacalcarata]|uniref:Uncharacterized protein n=2 Tax=Rotaria magnacalcarata TaxID=392030 RepID=A0A816EXK4_9BILA|nr:unnamed protein product [Rotaria magnacalcarata]CAF2155842.1 unnamed protein product [Rotaria magnacalcarata]